MKESIVFTGGGTGGHIFPGLAVAEYLRGKFDGDIVWIGSGSAMERGIVERWGLRFFSVPSGKLRRYFSLRNFIDVFKIGAGLVVSVFLLLKLKPALVFSKGGFVSVPPVVAARLLKIPVFTHESDFDPGLATKINARFAGTVFVAYEETKICFPEPIRSKVLVSGNPVRAEIFRGSAEAGRKRFGIAPDLPVLLVLGGSQGSREINTLVAQLVDELTGRFFVIHQTGEAARDLNDGGIDGAGREGTGAISGRYVRLPFLREELPDALAAADLVICRSGAGTIWENAALGKPALLIPLSGSGTRGDQVRNAEFFASIGAAEVLASDERNAVVLREKIRSLMDNREKLSSMGAAAGTLGTRNASEYIGLKLLEQTEKHV